MSEGEIYEYMKIKAAKNGWVLVYTTKRENPMMVASTFEDNGVYKDEKMVFEETKGVSNEKALENALDHMKTLLLANKKSSE